MKPSLALATLIAVVSSGEAASAAETAPASQTQTAKGDAPVFAGGLSREEIQGAVSFDAIVRCYDAALARNAALRGRVTTEWKIDADGRVVQPRIIESDIADDQMHRCLVDVLHRQRFPKPKGGGDVFVTYPFFFSAFQEQPRASPAVLAERKASNTQPLVLGLCLGAAAGAASGAVVYFSLRQTLAEAVYGVPTDGEGATLMAPTILGGLLVGGAAGSVLGYLLSDGLEKR